MPEYQSPGAAFSGAFEEFMARRDAKKRQDLLDTLAIKREDRMMQAALETQQEHRLMLKEHEEALEEKKHKDETKDFEDRMKNVVMGDIPDREMVMQADKLGIGGQYFPKPPESIPGVVAVPLNPGGPDKGSMRLGLQAPSDASVRPYRGTPNERRAQALVGMDPNSQEYRQALVVMDQEAGRSPAANLIAPPHANPVVPDTKPVMRISASGKMEQIGDAPPGTHFVTEPQPRDTSAGDARKTAHRDQVYHQAEAELTKLAAPYEAQVQAINDLGISLNARTPQADALIAPLVLKATVSGAGSGFRMTRPEIEAVVGGRSVWESLQAKLNQWSLDPTKALSITDEQRTQLRSLAKAIRKKAHDAVDKISKARHQLDESDDPKAIQKIVTGVHDSVFLSDEDADTLEQTKSPADIIARIRGKKKKAE